MYLSGKPVKELADEYGLVEKTIYKWKNLYAAIIKVDEFFHALKKEKIYRHVYQDSKEDYDNIFEYIESWYNKRRTHSSLGYKPPIAVHAEGAA